MAVCPSQASLHAGATLAPVDHLPISQTDRVICVLGAAAQDFLFSRMKGRETLGQPFEYELDLLSEKVDVDLATVVGKDLTIRVTLESGDHRFIHGVVTQFKMSGSDGRHARYRALLHPALWLQ